MTVSGVPDLDAKSGITKPRIDLLAAAGGSGPTYSVSGTVTVSGGGALAGVTMTLTGGSSTTTNSSGVYTLTGLSDSITYTITPGMSGYTFSPTNRAVTISGANVTGQNFTATGQPTMSLSVSPASVVRGSAVTVTFGGVSVPTTTDWIGLYAAGAPDVYPNNIIWSFSGSCTQTAGTARASGSCQYTVPANLPAGTYEFRLFANNGYTRLAVSNALTVN